MVSKIKEILSSVRFWQVVVAVVLHAVGKEYADFQPVADAIASVLGVSVIIGSADKFSKNLGGK